MWPEQQLMEFSCGSNEWPQRFRRRQLDCFGFLNTFHLRQEASAWVQLTAGKFWCWTSQWINYSCPDTSQTTTNCILIFEPTDTQYQNQLFWLGFNKCAMKRTSVLYRRLRCWWHHSDDGFCIKQKKSSNWHCCHIKQYISETKTKININSVEI